MTKHPTRRRILQSAAAIPLMWPDMQPLLRWLPGGDDRCLLVLELIGGNDGLNTLIPTDDAHYAKARPTLAKVRSGAHAVGDGFALHPALTDLHRLFREECCAIVHGVGYQPPDRSHFLSRDIWHSADPSLRRTTAHTTGWLGRAADWLGAGGAAVPGLSIGSRQVPLLLSGEATVVPTLQRIEDYQIWVDPSGGRSSERRDALMDLIRSGDLGDGELARFTHRVAQSAAESAERLRSALRAYTPAAEYPSDPLGRQLQLVSRVLVSGFGTRLFHVGFGGFDTHAQQAPAHTGLLRQLSRALGALLADLRAHDRADRVAILVHSEFGRRVAENQSLGTDHGAAGPAFVLGGGVRPGLHGSAPDLGDLLDGDVRMTTDFRRVYRDLLDWLQIPADEVLSAALPSVGLFG